MASKTTTLKTIRIKNETAAYFAGKPLNRVVESVHTLAINHEVEIDKGEVKIAQNQS